MNLYDKEQLKKIQKLINIERIKVGLPVLTQEQTIVELIHFTAAQKACYIASVVINRTEDKY